MNSGSSEGGGELVEVRPMSELSKEASIPRTESSRLVSLGIGSYSIHNVKDIIRQERGGVEDTIQLKQNIASVDLYKYCMCTHVELTSNSVRAEQYESVQYEYRRKRNCYGSFQARIRTSKVADRF